MLVGWFNVKTQFYDYRDSGSDECLIFIMGIPILVRWYLYIELASTIFHAYFQKYVINKQFSGWQLNIEIIVNFSFRCFWHDFIVVDFKQCMATGQIDKNI